MNQADLQKCLKEVLGEDSNRDLGRLEEELMALHRGNDWNAAARLVRDEVAKLIADPKCGRRRLLAGLDAFIEAIRTRGLSATDERRL